MLKLPSRPLQQVRRCEGQLQSYSSTHGMADENASFPAKKHAVRFSHMLEHNRSGRSLERRGSPRQSAWCPPTGAPAWARQCQAA